MTEATVDDATRAIELIRAVGGSLASVTGDAACDAIALYEAVGARGATVVVPPTKTASVSTETVVERSRSYDPEGEEDRTATVEERIWLSAGARGERVLPVQVDHRA